MTAERPVEGCLLRLVFLLVLVEAGWLLFQITGRAYRASGGAMQLPEFRTRVLASSDERSGARIL